jgi:TrpR-related protein YerC/YecD
MDEAMRFVYQALSQVESPEELARLFEDWLTPREIEELKSRLDIAYRLYRGQTYETIQQETGASSTTISRVRRCIYYGAGGYRLVFERLDAGHETPSGRA